MDLQKIDANFKVETTANENDIVFYDVKNEPFSIYGLYPVGEVGDFERMPEEVAALVSPGVQRLAKCTAGGRVRFCTDSRYIAIRTVMPSICHMDHMALTGSSAFDLYVDDPTSGTSTFHNSFRPSFDFTGGYESKTTFSDRSMRCVTIHFPTYSAVASLEIGLEPNARLDRGMAYRDLAPVVYYGSSITQGGCASRPGNTYQSIISQRMNINHVNLGFSGNAKAEDAMIEYLATCPMSVFVSDYDHNAPTKEHLAQTHAKLYQTIRKSHPDIPYIMLSRPNFYHRPDDEARRDIIYKTYMDARAAGDRLVWFIDGESLFRGKYANICTVDGTHPNDMGFALMADAVEHVLRAALTEVRRR